MKSVRIILALGILALSSSAFAVTPQFQFQPPPPTCKSPIADFFYDLGFKKACGTTVSVPEPATLGLLGISLMGLAVKRRRK